MTDVKTTTNNPKKEPTRIVVTTPEKFEKLASTSLETTQRLAKRINKLFQTAFADFYGSTIYCMSGNGNTAPNQQFMVELHFKPMTAGSIPASDGRVRAFQPIDERADATDLVGNLKRLRGTYSSSARFQMTNDAAEILSEFVMPGITVDPFKPETFNGIKAEYVDNVQFGQAPVMVKVGSIDLVRLIRKIYGDKNQDGKRVDYGIIPYGPVVPNMNNQMVANNANWRVIMMQVEADKTFDIAAEFGLIPASTGCMGSIVTGIN